MSMEQDLEHSRAASLQGQGMSKDTFSSKVDISLIYKPLQTIIYLLMIKIYEQIIMVSVLINIQAIFLSYLLFQTHRFALYP